MVVIGLLAADRAGVSARTQGDDAHKDKTRNTESSSVRWQLNNMDKRGKSHSVME